MKLHSHTVLSLALSLLPRYAYAAGDIVVGEFESATYGQWTAQGTAFGTGPALGARPAQLQVRGFRGNGIASSELEGDAPKGTLSSPVFKIERRFISFVIGGGA